MVQGDRTGCTQILQHLAYVDPGLAHGFRGLGFRDMQDFGFFEGLYMLFFLL